jgi:hypothetical protein
LKAFDSVVALIFFFLGQEQKEGSLCLMQGLWFANPLCWSSPMKDYAIHDYFSRLGPNLQQLGGVCSSPTKGIPFSSM